MLNYIKAELYRNFNRKYFWGYTGAFAVFAVLINILLKISNSNNQIDTLEMTAYMLSAIVFLLLPIVDMVTAEEHKNGTIKNIVSSDASRNTIILSKFIVSIILGFLYAAIVFCAYYASGTLLFGIGKSNVKLGFLRILTSVPLYIGALAIGTFMATVIKNNTIFAFVYAGVFSIIPQIIKLFAVIFPQLIHFFQKVYNVLITVQLDSFRLSFTPAVVSKTVISGIIYTLVFMSLSLVCFKNEEI